MIIVERKNESNTEINRITNEAIHCQTIKDDKGKTQLLIFNDDKGKNSHYVCIILTPRETNAVLELAEKLQRT